MIDITTCPKCRSYNVFVVDSRKNYGKIWRRKKCSDCGFRYSTYEVSAKDLERTEKILKLMSEVQSISSIFDEITRLGDEDDFTE